MPAALPFRGLGSVDENRNIKLGIFNRWRIKTSRMYRYLILIKFKTR